MAQLTSISWTDRSANPIRARDRKTGRVGWHCVFESPGCLNCYSQDFNGRFGTGYRYIKRAEREVELFLDLSSMDKVRRLRKKHQKVFLCDMTDLFAEFVPFDWIDQVMAMIAATPGQTFQVLTKRPARMARYFASRTLGDAYTNVLRMADREKAHEPSPLDHVRSIIRLTDTLERDHGFVSAHQPPREWPLPNLWLGTSAEDQERADERIPHLLKTPAAIRFLSVEPLLGPVDLTAIGHGDQRGLNALTGEFRYYREDDGEPCSDWGSAIDWVIAGGESGRKARPCEFRWLRSLRDQCRDAGVAWWLKQLGSNPHGDWGSDDYPTVSVGHSTAGGLVWRSEASRCKNGRWKLRSTKGEATAEWPADLREDCQRFPVVPAPAAF